MMPTTDAEYDSMMGDCVLGPSSSGRHRRPARAQCERRCMCVADVVFSVGESTVRNVVTD